MIGEPSARNGVAQSCHQSLIEAQIVMGIELRAEHFVNLLQMMQVGARKVATGIAVTARIEWPRVVAVHCIAKLDDPLGGIDPAISYTSSTVNCL